jgi:hypothetical protein
MMPMIVRPIGRKTNIKQRRYFQLQFPNLGELGVQDSYTESLPYLQELGVALDNGRHKITFGHNTSELVHRWSPYIQGFSGVFVDSVIEAYGHEYNLGSRSSCILDPFAGCGTVQVSSKRNGIRSVGTELNPLLAYIGNVKLKYWQQNPETVATALARILTHLDSSDSHTVAAPSFLESQRQFNPGVLANLERLKWAVDNLEFSTLEKEQEAVRDLLLVAFSAILVDCSNLKRSPCLGYAPDKRVEDHWPQTLFRRKVESIVADLRLLQNHYGRVLTIPAEIHCANAATFRHQPHSVDLVITSPPYMNGLDYVINYKIEMAWLGFIKSHREAKAIKDEMVVCDNVSKGLISSFAMAEKPFSDKWLDEIRERIAANIRRRGVYRRPDMPHIVDKYFQDMFKVLDRINPAIKPGGRLIMVVGDSLIAETYVPTDLILAKMATKLSLPLEVERIEQARTRRSGQRRDYVLRETIVTLRKPKALS